MKIGIDARMYGPKQRGLGVYVEELLENLEKTDLENEYIVFLRRENFSLYQPKNPKFKKVLADIRWYSLGEQILFPFILKKQKLDIMHFPHWNVPVFYRKTFVVTIHDLILWHFKDRRVSTKSVLIYNIKYFLFRKLLLWVVKKAQHIITVSNFVKTDIQNVFGLDSSKISVIYEGLGERDISMLKEQKNDEKYILYVGAAYPHKNLEKLILAWKEVLKELNGFKLVLVGKKDYFYERLEKFTENQLDKKSDTVVFKGFVKKEDLPNIYRSASLFVFPSLYEGFGLPPLEAMSYGVPIVSSSASCMPEILKDAAYYFDPNNEKQLTKAIVRGVIDTALRGELFKNSKKIVNKYSWLKCAEETVKVYKKIK